MHGEATSLWRLRSDEDKLYRRASQPFAARHDTGIAIQPLHYAGDEWAMSQDCEWSCADPVLLEASARRRIQEARTWNMPSRRFCGLQLELQWTFTEERRHSAPDGGFHPTFTLAHLIVCRGLALRRDSRRDS